MSMFRNLDLSEPPCMSIPENDIEYTIIHGDQELFLPEDILNRTLSRAMHLTHIQRPSFSSHPQRIQSTFSSEPFMQRLSHHLFGLEAASHDPIIWVKNGGHRKYKWTAEVEHGNRKYKWTAKIKCSDELEQKKRRQFVQEIDARKVKEIKHYDQSAVFRQKRRGVVSKVKGKLSAEDAAVMIQLEFKKYLIRRSKTLRALRELAAVKAKVKDIRSLYSSFSCRQRIKSDREERLKFSEMILALFLTVVAVEGADLMVCSARKSMLDELEAILDAVDPQPPGKLNLMGRRMF